MPKTISLMSVNCKRCGKGLLASDRSLYGADAHKKAFGIVCDTCTSPKELTEILDVTGKAIQDNFGYQFDVKN